MLSRSYHVVDDFYSDPNRIRLAALGLCFTEPDEVTGWRTRPYHPRGIRRLIETKFRVHIDGWENDPTAVELCNGVFLSAFSSGARAEPVGIHFDEPARWMMMVVYLTPNAPKDAGTSFWQHRATGLVCRPTNKDAERLGLSVRDLNALLEKDSQVRKRWIETDRVSNCFNRAVMFPSGLLHSATRHFGNNYRNGRLYQAFHFPIATSNHS